MGLIHFKKREWAEAKNEFEKLLRIKVNHLGAWTHLARTWAALGQKEKAVETFQKALKIDENNLQVQEAWVDYCVQVRDERAIPQLSFLLDRAAAENNAERMVYFSREAISLRPELISAREHLIQGLQALGNHEEAADACRALAFLYEQQGQLTESTLWLKKADQYQPGSAKEAPKLIPPDEPMMELEPEPILEPASLSPFLMAAIPEIPLASEPILVLPTKKALEEEVPAKPTLTVIASPPPTPLAPPPAPESPALDSLEAKLKTAQICAKQGLLKAAIEIYHQILMERPDLIKVRQELNEVNALYLKKWMESKNK
jgi:tetratricopeptide (TPR) repeat protein